MGTPLVSVVIPTYARAAFLGEALDSVLGQTIRDLEVVVVEDGSHAAGDMLGKYAGRVQYVWQPHQGPALARNTGAHVSRGQWLAFIDDDDLWLPEKLERQLAFAKRFPEFGMLHTDHYVLQDGKLRLGPRVLPRHEIPSGWVGSTLLLNNFVVMSSVLIKKTEFDRSEGFAGRFGLVEDYHLWLRMSRQCQVGFVDEPLTVYRDHAGGISSDRLPWYLKQKAVLESFVADTPGVFREYGTLTVRRRLSEVCWTAAYAHFADKHYRIARRLFLSTWRWTPWNLTPLVYACACVTGSSGVRAIRTIRELFG